MELLYVGIALSIMLSAIMLYCDSIREHGCWNVPDLSEIIGYTIFAIPVFPFWLVRQILLIIDKFIDDHF